MTSFVSLKQFKGQVARGLIHDPGLHLTKGATLVIRAAGERRKHFIISTPRVDRENDSISVSGWELAAHERNPVVLWSHDWDAPPIGRTVEIGIEDDQLQAVVEFVPADVPVVGDLAEMAWRLCDAGFLSAASVGFRPLEFAVAKDRVTEEDWYPPVNFLRHELVEWSLVTIPANPETTILSPANAASAGPVPDAAPVVDPAPGERGLRQPPARPGREATGREAMLRALRIAERRRRMRAACF